MPRLVVRPSGDVASFRRVVEPFLLRHEATNCLPIGLLPGLAAGEWNDPYLAVVERDSEPVLVVLRTPPNDLVLSHDEHSYAVGSLVEALQETHGDGPFPGVLAPAAVADAFAEHWERSTGTRLVLGQRQRVYRLDHVTPVAGVPGEARRASTEDASLLRTWIAAFGAEAIPSKASDAQALATRWLSSPLRQLWLWEVDGVPVAMAGAGSPTPNGIRISLVYTPTARRGHGYASALVADLSERQLRSGRTFCFLFTDVTNPTSNRIYGRLGYRPVNEQHQYVQSGASAAS